MENQEKTNAQDKNAMTPMAESLSHKTTFDCTAIEKPYTCGGDNYVIGYGDFRGSAGLVERVYIKNGTVVGTLTIKTKDGDFLDMTDVNSKQYLDESKSDPCKVGSSYWTYKTK